MSAYLVAPEQISEMVKWVSTSRHTINNYNIFTKKRMDITPAAMVKTLAKANVDSINSRYKENDTGDDFVADCLAELETGPISLIGKHYVPDPSLSAADIYKMCCNYDYQACEVDNWISTDAYWICHHIMHTAADAMATTAKHKWGYTKGAA